MLKHVRVQLLDVNPDDEVGHIALTNLNVTIEDRLAAGRLYAGSAGS